MIESTIDRSTSEVTYGSVRSPLMMDGWLEFNQATWDVTPHRVRFAEGGSSGPAVEAIYYLNAAGRIVIPPHTPYLPVTFEPALEDAPIHTDQQWAAVGHLLVRDMRERGLRHAVPLPPYIQDVRPWQRAHFVTDVKYTYHLSLPFDDSSMRKNIRRSIARSQNKGFVCERTNNLEHLHECLLETEERQGFRHDLRVSDLRLAQSRLREDAFRVYVCYSPDGEAVSASVELHQPGVMALAWLAGTKTAYLSSGVSQHLVRFVLDDLYAAGATGYDFVGAAIPSVAAFKAHWGPTLVPRYVVDGGGRALVRYAKNVLAFKRGAS